MSTTRDTKLFIDGKWRSSSDGGVIDVINPATEEVVGTVAKATIDDLNDALLAAEKGFEIWKTTSPFDRYKILRRAANLLRHKAPQIAPLMTIEQGKPLAEANAEIAVGADRIDWMAEEGRRTYGRVIPARAGHITQHTFKEPVGPVAAFTPWNFPLNQILQKMPAALAAGCSIIVKAPEEAPACCALLFEAFQEAGVPNGVISLIFGIPSEISNYLIASPIIKKITFTGSTSVGKLLAAKAGEHMKLATMELGGHAPAIVFDDADVQVAADILASNKFRNAGQVCISPTRFLVHEKIYENFLEKFTKNTEAIKIGDGLKPDTTMGPLAHERRLKAMDSFVADAIGKGAEVSFGGNRVGNKGYFYSPTVLTNVSKDSLIMNEEPFGPLAPISKFRELEEAVQEANRLPYGLASYAYTSSASVAAALGDKIRSGMVSINHHGLALPETPFGGISDSGYGNEGGAEGIEPYQQTKFITQSNT